MTRIFVECGVISCCKHLIGRRKFDAIIKKLQADINRESCVMKAVSNFDDNYPHEMKL